MGMHPFRKRLQVRQHAEDRLVTPGAVPDRRERLLQMLLKARDSRGVQASRWSVPTSTCIYRRNNPRSRRWTRCDAGLVVTASAKYWSIRQVRPSSAVTDRGTSALESFRVVFWVMLCPFPRPIFRGVKHKTLPERRLSYSEMSISGDLYIPWM